VNKAINKQGKKNRHSVQKYKQTDLGGVTDGVVFEKKKSISILFGGASSTKDCVSFLFV